MDRFDGLPTDKLTGALVAFGLLVRRVDDVETFEIFLKTGRERVVESVVGSEEGIAAGLGTVEDAKRGDARRLELVSDICDDNRGQREARTRGSKADAPECQRSSFEKAEEGGRFAESV